MCGDWQSGRNRRSAGMQTCLKKGTQIMTSNHIHVYLHTLLTNKRAFLYEATASAPPVSYTLPSSSRQCYKLILRDPKQSAHKVWNRTQGSSRWFTELYLHFSAMCFSKSWRCKASINPLPPKNTNN